MARGRVITRTSGQTLKDVINGKPGRRAAHRQAREDWMQGKTKEFPWSACNGKRTQRLKELRNGK